MKVSPLAHALSYVLAVLAAVGCVLNLRFPSLFSDSASLKAQLAGQDLATLLIAVPGLLVAIRASVRRHLIARLVWIGLLGYFAYTYASYVTLMQYHRLFLWNVVLFSLAFYATVLAFGSIEPATVAKEHRGGPAVRLAAIFCLIAAFGVAGMWLSELVPAAIHGTVPRVVRVDGVTNMAIQALDLAILVPLFVAAGVMLLRGKPWGYVLAPVVLVKIVTLGAAVLMMAAAMVSRGAEVNPGQIAFIGGLTIGAIGVAAFFLKGLRPGGSDG